MKGDASGERRVISVLIGDVSFDFTAELMAGISDAAAAAGVQVVFLLGMQRHSAQPVTSAPWKQAINYNSIYDYAPLVGADASIIACGSLSGFSGEGIYQKFLCRFEDKPYVVLQERMERRAPRSSYLVVDNYQSFSQCIDHLIVHHGLQKIALLCGPRGHSDARERLRAYRDCMQKHSLTITDSMIAYGDFSEYVDHLVSQLLDDNPGLEAIAFANDEMAKAGYRECRRRGLTVGRDLAITGFDNFGSGRSMEPPLTTVSQDIYKMGTKAVEQALRLTEDKAVQPLEMRTEFLARRSCGCTGRTFSFLFTGADAGAERMISFAIDGIVNGYADHFARVERKRYIQSLCECFAYLREAALRDPPVLPGDQRLTEFLNGFFDRSEQSLLLLSRSLTEFLTQAFSADTLPLPVRHFAMLVAYLQHFLHMREVHILEDSFDTFRGQSWIAPELTRGLYGQAEEGEAYRLVLERMQAAGFEQLYICLLEEPRRQGPESWQTAPGTLRLTAYANTGGVHVFNWETAPLMDMANPLRCLPGIQDTSTMMALSIFSGENQYGVLLCETKRNRGALLQSVGLQLGMLIDFLELRRREKRISAELENIREKNEILNFLSEYDQLCGLLNRRGFIERAIRLNRENIGREALCAFMDMDYLKQINDTFGHSEGDLALQSVSAILKRITTPDALLGRIGGDEFIGLFLSDDPRFEEDFIQKLRLECHRYNEGSERPYRLEVSVGIVRFLCRMGLEVSSVIAEADRRLYEAKRGRTARTLQLKADKACKVSDPDRDDTAP